MYKLCTLKCVLHKSFPATYTISFPFRAFSISQYSSEQGQPKHFQKNFLREESINSSSQLYYGLVTSSSSQLYMDQFLVLKCTVYGPVLVLMFLYKLPCVGEPCICEILLYKGLDKGWTGVKTNYRISLDKPQAKFSQIYRDTFLRRVVLNALRWG